MFAGESKVFKIRLRTFWDFEWVHKITAGIQMADYQTYKKYNKRGLEFITFKKVNISSSQLRKI